MWVMRAGLALLAAGQLVPGLWALIAPRGFYSSFPGVGSAWVAADGPFNHHLVVDAGAGLAATGVALAVAAMSSSRPVRVVALVAYLVHALPHMLYHAGHPPAALGGVEQTLTWAPLAAGVLLAAALLPAAARPAVPRQEAPRGVASPEAASAEAASPEAASAEQRPGAARVPAITGAPRNLLLRAAFAAARRRLGAVPEAWRITARVPRVALPRILSDAAHQRTRLVPASVGALAALRAATVVECAFCVDILSAAATGAGVRGEQIRELPRWRDSAAFDDEERLALSLADAMTATPAEVPAGLVTALVDRFGADGTVELVSAVGHENARARANKALGVPPQGFAAAASCPLPGHTSPVPGEVSL